MTPERARILELEAEVAELRAEVEAWRANDSEDHDDQKALARELKMKRLFKTTTVKGSSAGGAQTRIALKLMDRPDWVFSNGVLMSEIASDDRDLSWTRINVEICRLRQRLASLGLAGTVVNVWGKGYSMTPEGAARLRALLDAQP